VEDSYQAMQNTQQQPQETELSQESSSRFNYCIDTTSAALIKFTTWLLTTVTAEPELTGTTTFPRKMFFCLNWSLPSDYFTFSDLECCIFNFSIEYWDNSSLSTNW